MNGMRRTAGSVVLLLILPMIGPMSADAQSGRSAGPNWTEEKQELIDFGKQFDTAGELYETLTAGIEDRTLTLEEIPDWTGLWERDASAAQYDPDQGPGFVPTARLKGQYVGLMQERVDNALEGRVYDETSACGVPRGYPGNIRNPRPWEFAIMTHQTWILNEAQNEVRRIYTDGRGHTPEEIAFPSEDGDTIGIWDGDRLITYTKNVKEGWMSRMQPYFSDQIEGVEIWEKINEETMQGDVWLYDPEALEEPWFTRQIYKKEVQPFEGMPLRIHFWECDNPNNAITRTQGGGSNHTDFAFTDVDDTQEED